MSKRVSVLKLSALLSSVKKKVDLISKDKREIFIFGAGNTAKLYSKCFDVEGIQPAGFLDNDITKHGKKLPRGGGD